MLSLFANDVYNIARSVQPVKRLVLIAIHRQIPYAPETFDAVVIANALHILQDPDKVMAEIRRVLKPGGWLFAPTFVYGGGRLAGFRTWCMERTGFHVYHPWNAGEFLSYLSRQDFWVVEHALLGKRTLPLCYAACRWTPRGISPHKIW